jgi:RHS repeat-associated protein
LLLSEKPRHGVASKNPALNQGINEANSTAAIGLRAGLLLNRVQSRYTGKERDAESGLDYFGARYYASSMGRWMSPDWADKPEAVPYSSLDDPQSLNLYGYVLNNPLSRSDADGHWPDTDSATWQMLVGLGKSAYNATVVPVSMVMQGTLHLSSPDQFPGGHAASLPAQNEDQAAGLKIGDEAMVMSIMFTGPEGAASELFEEGAAGAGEEAGPSEAYNRRAHYGDTPTAADRRAVGGESVDHHPPLVKRYYEGDPAKGEKPGYKQTPAERRASANDRSRMRPSTKAAQRRQGGEMSQYSKEQKKKNGLK